MVFVEKKLYDSKLKLDIYELYSGEYMATNEKGFAISTLLGSCVSVCLRDEVSGVVGINHYLSPGNIRNKDTMFSGSGRYGIVAMDKLLAEVEKLGGKRNRLKAKVFGGASNNSISKSVADSNIEFALSYLKMEGIPVVTQDTGGNLGRKLILIPDSFEVYVRLFSQQQENIPSGK